MFFHFVFQRTANIPTFLQIFVFFVSEGALAVLPIFPYVFKGISCFVFKVLVVQAKPLSFHTYYLFHIGGVDNTPKRSYLLFSLYSKGYWRCCLWPLHCHKYFMIHIRQYCRCSYTPLHSFIFFPFCVIKDLGNVTNIPYTPSRIGYNLI